MRFAREVVEAPQVVSRDLLARAKASTAGAVAGRVRLEADLAEGEHQPTACPARARHEAKVLVDRSVVDVADHTLPYEDGTLARSKSLPFECRGQAAREVGSVEIERDISQGRGKLYACALEHTPLPFQLTSEVDLVHGCPASGDLGHAKTARIEARTEQDNLVEAGL